MKKFIIILLSILMLSLNIMAQNNAVKIGIAGLTHSHVHGLLGRDNKVDINIVGIAEPDRDLALRFSKQYGFSMSIVYNTLDEMIAVTKPEAVVAFGSIYQHLEVVEKCAPKGIHVMVEKPLAVSMEHARKMEALARKYKIQLLTNYETTWYPSNSRAYEFLNNDTIGEIRKVIVHDGHRGPKKVGVNSEFLNWLTDPVQDGGGAIVDFGCYGVNLMNWLMKGVRPNTVTAVTQQLQPENNPKVDDESIIILKYNKANAIIQGSWNWPIGRKDMEIYGLRGAIYCDNKYNLRIRIGEGYDGFREQSYKFKDLDYPENDPFAYFAAVITGKVKPKPFDLSSLENNMLVVEILDAARQSAKNNQSITLR